MQPTFLYNPYISPLVITLRQEMCSFFCFLHFFLQIVLFQDDEPATAKLPESLDRTF